MADTSAKPGLTDRQLEDAKFLFLDNLAQEGAINVATSKGIGNKGQDTLTVKGEKNGVISNYTLDRQGNLTVKTSFHDGASVATTIDPTGKRTPLARFLTHSLDETELSKLENGSIQNADKMHDYRGFNLGKRNDSRTVEDMGKAIEARADVRLGERLRGEQTALKVLNETVNELAAHRIADNIDHKLDLIAKGKMSIEDAGEITKILGDNNITDPEKFKTAAQDYADRLRGAEGSKLVGELRESAQAKEGAKLLSGLLERSPSFGKEAAALGKETKVATEVLEHPGLTETFLKATGKVVGHAAVPVGLAIAAHEASAKDAIAQDAVAHGQMSPEALTEYRGIQAAQMATVVDPTVIGGEMAVQKGYKAFAEANNLSPELAESLRPSALTDVVPEVKQLSPADLSAEQNKFDRIYDGVSNIKPEDLPPENRPALEALQENKSLITATEQKLDGKAGQLGADGFDRGKELANLDKYQQQYKEVYDDLDQSGQLDGIDNHIAAQKEQKAPAATADTAIAATQEKTPPIAANDEEYGQSPSQTAARPPASRPAASAPAPT